MHALTSSKTISALEAFCKSIGGSPKRFHFDFNKKLIGGDMFKWIREQKSSVIAAPAGGQSSNGLIECTWHTIIQMMRAYIT